MQRERKKERIKETNKERKNKRNKQTNKDFVTFPLSKSKVNANFYNRET